MSDAKQSDLLEIVQVEGVTVVRFTRRTILDPLLIENLSQRMLTLVQEQNCRRMVLNFSRVESVTSAMFGALVSLYKSITAGGGQLAFAAVDPFLLQIFRLCKLPSSIPIHASEAEAVKALVGEGQRMDGNQTE